MPARGRRRRSYGAGLQGPALTRGDLGEGLPAACQSSEVFRREPRHPSTEMLVAALLELIDQLEARLRALQQDGSPVAGVLVPSHVTGADEAIREHARRGESYAEQLREASDGRDLFI